MEAIKKIKWAILGTYMAWVILAIIGYVFYDFGLTGLLSPIWLPLGVLFTAILFVCIMGIVGDRLKLINPPSCENCAFGKCRSVTGQCLGETKGEVYGQTCPYYMLEERSFDR